MRFFFYGTLLHGAGNPVAEALHRRLGPGTPAQVSGQLFALPDPAGWYPALLLDPGGAPVHGMVYAALPEFGPADLAAIDAWEDCRADGHGEYRRALLPVASAGVDLHAQAYLYNAALPPGAEPVSDGDFPAFLARRGLAAFR